MNSNEIDQITEKLPSLLPWQLSQFYEAIAAASDAAANPSKCRSCGATVIWGKTANLKNCPFDIATGESHFKTCPQANSWKKNALPGLYS